MESADRQFFSSHAVHIKVWICSERLRFLGGVCSRAMPGGSHHKLTTPADDISVLIRTGSLQRIAEVAKTCVSAACGSLRNENII